jgi:ABC-2 type transport system ATP-binding protein
VIDVKDLTKRFGPVTAVDGVSFHVAADTVVGFLGANGAGKSTTMRMLTTFLPPTAGEASIDGHDTLSDPLGVRRVVGYLPESPPLYPDLRVVEYLRHIAVMREVPLRRVSRRVGEVIERCWLKEVRFRPIRTLSKGFRQRVGLAQAMVHQPKILILDEPTIGLDPSQIRETRELIRHLGELHTVLLSTHILTEVEQICSRVLIIANGRLVADDTLANLARQAGDQQVIDLVVKGPADRLKGMLENVEGVRAVRQVGGERGAVKFELVAAAGVRVIEAAGERLAKSSWPVHELRARSQRLEDIYRAITQAERVV